MPLGWYYAQGLIPIGYDSSDDDDSPCELPDGRMVCGPHGLVVCGKCCVDFSFMNEDADEDDEEEEDADDEDDEEEDEDLPTNDGNEYKPVRHDFGRAKRRGSGRAFPTKFIPPTDSTLPTDLFLGRTIRTVQPR